MIAPSAPKDTRKIPSLDGLRGVSILLVMLGHAQGTRGFPSWIPSFVTSHASLGVQIFFVISGYLITTLILDEERNTGKISLKLFYARRTIRIFPPLYLFLLCLTIGSWTGILELPKYNLLFAATYMMNFVPSGTGTWVTGHLWSLSAEEQFYLVWPAAIRFAGRARALAFAAILAVCSPLVALAVYQVNHDLGVRFSGVFSDSIACGCVLAGAMPWLRRQKLFWAALSARAGCLVVLIIPLIDHRNHPRIHLLVTETVLNLCVCYCIARYTEFPKTIGGRFLNNRAVGSVGRISYSMYLWQQLFLNMHGTALLQAFPINMVATFCCAAISYTIVERPLASLRKRLRPNATTTGLRFTNTPAANHRTYIRRHDA
jgi:peptidoglycan/LPS O-acetylase OafA/YrhL